MQTRIAPSHLEVIFILIYKFTLNFGYGKYCYTKYTSCHLESYHFILGRGGALLVEVGEGFNCQYIKWPAKLKGIDKTFFSFRSHITAEKGGFFKGSICKF